MIYDIEIRATEATDVNAHFIVDSQYEMAKCVDLILSQGYEVLISEVREDG